MIQLSGSGRQYLNTIHHRGPGRSGIIRLSLVLSLAVRRPRTKPSSDRNSWSLDLALVLQWTPEQSDSLTRRASSPSEDDRCHLAVSRVMIGPRSSLLSYFSAAVAYPHDSDFWCCYTGPLAELALCRSCFPRSPRKLIGKSGAVCVTLCGVQWLWLQMRRYHSNSPDPRHSRPISELIQGPPPAISTISQFSHSCQDLRLLSALSASLVTPARTSACYQHYQPV
ncbi:hypothetical protein RRG08_060994 [Elysia crispata]|uniref:Uncharacterized protein n=1 Tax=Elysia crispata TaxID=231223 RepID=A0AAE1E4Q9_9GAST|nr:hypothetical protein RRG08_060994 [Elysia crispata]